MLKIVALSAPDCCLCARGPANRKGDCCAHPGAHRYCATHQARVAKIEIRGLCNGTARNTQLEDGTRCRCAQYAFKGTTVCNFHGARVANTRRKAASRVTRAQAEAQIEKIRQDRGMGKNVSAIAVIQFCLDECAFWVTEWRNEVHRLSNGDPGRLIRENYDGDLSLQIAFLCLADWIDRSTKTAKLALDAGIQERRQKLDEERTAMIGAAILRTLAELGIDEARARPAIARHLRALPA